MSLEQLNSARALVRKNPEQYPTLVRGILKVGNRPEAEIRAWAAGFVADFLGSPTVDNETKAEFVPELLPVLAVWVKDENASVAKLGICVLSDLYVRVYKRTVVAGDKTVWGVVRVLKNLALQRWTPQCSSGIAFAAIKLAQSVVLAHTASPVRNHAFLDGIELTAEATALLDRLLSVFMTSETGKFSEFSASVNASVSLALACPQLTPRIMASILSYNISLALPSLGENSQLTLRWVIKLFTTALQPFKQPFPQIQVFLAGLTAFASSNSLKRSAEDSEITAKRAKVKESPKPEEIRTYKQLYTLSERLAAIDARSLPPNIAAAIAVAGLGRSSQQTLDDMISQIRQRLETLPTEPKLEPAPEPVPERAAVTEPEEIVPAEEEEEETVRGPTRAALAVEVPENLTKFNAIFNRLLAQSPPRLAIRLGTWGLDGETKEFAQRKLYAQFVSDFRASLEPLVLWLTEEYYAKESSHESYFLLLSRVVDEIIPKLEVSDSRIFIRLLSEVPELNRDIIFKIKSSCLDPERSVVGARALKFIIMYKPPSREDCLDLAQELVAQGVSGVKEIVDRYRSSDKTDEASSS